MNLSDLKPRRTSFKVRLANRTVKLYFRPFTLRDEAWMQENFDDEDLQNIMFCKRNINKIASILWYQLEPKSKRLIFKAPATFKDLDEHGKIVSVEPKGVDRLIGLLSSSDLVSGLEAFAACRGINSKLLDTAEEEGGKTKKKLIGPSYLTLSRLNMATALNKFLK